MTVTALNAASPFASLDMSALLDTGREFTVAQNLAAVDRLDTVFAMLHATEKRIADDERADAEAGREPRPEHARLNPTRIVRAHVCTSMLTTSWHAGRLVDAALQLHTRLHRLNRVARDGLFDEAFLVDLACRLRDVPDDLVEGVEDIVVNAIRHQAENGDMPTRTSLGERIDRAIESIDADEADRQQEKAREKRRVSFRPRGSGMTSMWAMLPTEDAERLRARLRAIAEQTDADDPRTEQELMADALTGVGIGGVDDLRHDSPGVAAETGAADGTGAAAGAAAAPARREKLHITVIAAAAKGLPARVEFVRGAYSSFDWLCSQVLAEENDGVRFELVDPQPGAQDDPDAALKYKPSAALARRIRLRDRTCRHPGCSVPAESCELDHVIPFDHARPESGGPTTEWNLICLCKAHHQEKTFGSWTYLPGPLGELMIRTETGHEYRTYPDGMLAMARDDLSLDASRRWFERMYPWDEVNRCYGIRDPRPDSGDPPEPSPGPDLPT